MDAQAIVWFVIAAVAAFTGARMLFDRYVAKKPSAVQSRGGITLFAICLFLFALGALAAGLISIT